MSYKSLHILIAEDDEDDLELICSSFMNNASYTQVDTVKNGVELMDYLDQHRGHLPDLILTDLNMPKKDGYESLEEISSDPEFSKVPVFVYSTTLNPTYITKCERMGVKGFLLKPYRLREIEEIPERISKKMSELPATA